MADNGVLYTGFTPEFAREMGKLCGKADVIVPNLTEAAFMLGEEYVGDDYDEAYVHALLKRLTGLGCKTAILTGISYQPRPDRRGGLRLGRRHLCQLLQREAPRCASTALGTCSPPPAWGR